MASKLGELVLVPVDLGNRNWEKILPTVVQHEIASISHFVCEREKTARSFLSSLSKDIVQAKLHLHELDKHGKNDAFELLRPALAGNKIGLISEAGMPAVADPGNNMVRKAHELGIKVTPLIGPSSIFLALVSSGLNGQKFAFQGYLPIKENELGKTIKHLEIESKKFGMTQIFIETPYRNMKLFQFLLKRLSPKTDLCVATDLSCPSETIQTHSVQDWKSVKLDIHKRPTVFLFQA